MSNLPATIQNMATGLAVSVATISDVQGDQFMKFAKVGEYVYGADDVDVEPGQQWAINPHSFCHGYIAWGDKKHDNEGTLLGETMGSAIEPLVDVNSLDKVAGDWKAQCGFQLRCTEGEDKGVQCLYKASSLGFKKQWTAVVAAVVARINAKETGIVPLVLLEADSYRHKKHGKIFVPIINIVGWGEAGADMAAAEEPEKVEDGADGADGDVIEGDSKEVEKEEVEETPKRRTRAKKAETETKTEETPPRRRRRRGA